MEGELGTERGQAWKQIKATGLCRLTSKRVGDVEKKKKEKKKRAEK